MNFAPQGHPKKVSARRRLVVELTAEILKNSSSADFVLSSEYALCRRFGVSRVTVRLALGDMENEGLIYRRHGLGTFARGCSTRRRRGLGILIKCSDNLKLVQYVEIIRGAQTTMSSQRSSVMLISISPLVWPPEMAKQIGGVIVLGEDVLMEELEYLKRQNVPFLCVQQSQLGDGEADCFRLGLQSAMVLTERTVLKPDEEPAESDS